MKKGFTLIELLIVISIIGILAVALLPQVLSAPASARDAAKEAAVNNVVVALEQYNAANGKYPTALSCLGDGTTDATETALNAYFKSNAAPTLDVKSTPTTGNNLIGTCTGIYYCPLKDNRYFVGVATEKAGQGKGRYKGPAAAALCNGTEDASATVLAATSDTNVWGILQ